MAKKSAISGEYIITQEESGTIRVCKIFDNVLGSLREVAATVGFEIDPKWNTRQTGSNLIKAYGEGKMAEIGEYTVVKRENGAIETYRVYDNTIGALREIAESIGFEFDPDWTTRQFGSKLINEINK